MRVLLELWASGGLGTWGYSDGVHQDVGEIRATEDIRGLDAEPAGRRLSKILAPHLVDGRPVPDVLGIAPS